MGAPRWNWIPEPLSHCQTAPPGRAQGRGAGVPVLSDAEGSPPGDRDQRYSSSSYHDLSRFTGKFTIDQSPDQLIERGHHCLGKEPLLFKLDHETDHYQERQRH
eukprot:988941-Rhodomonas_salina.1